MCSINTDILPAAYAHQCGLPDGGCMNSVIYIARYDFIECAAFSMESHA